MQLSYYLLHIDNQPLDPQEAGEHKTLIVTVMYIIETVFSKLESYWRKHTHDVFLSSALIDHLSLELFPD